MLIEVQSVVLLKTETNNFLFQKKNVSLYKLKKTQL